MPWSPRLVRGEAATLWDTRHGHGEIAAYLHDLGGRSICIHVRNQTLLSILLAVSGCGVAGTDPVAGDDGVGPMDPVTMSEIVISPSGFEARVVGDAAVLHDFTAKLVAPDGSARDVTSEVSFSLADSRFGRFHGNQLTVAGGGAGPTQVVATLGMQRGTAPLTVFVTGIRNQGAPDATPVLFDSATPASGCAPTVAYPADQTLVPANLGSLDVHWTDATSDVYRVHVHNTYVDLTYFMPRNPISGDLQWFIVDTDWPVFETSHANIAVEVAGMSSAAPTTKCEAASRTVNVTRDRALGGVYYWSTDWVARAAGLTGQDVVRYDLAKPAIAPAPMFTDATRPSACVGCHALSRDGKRIAMTLDSANGRGSVVDLPTNRELMPAGASAPRWSTAVFNHDGSKLVAVQDGQMRLITATSGETLATLPNTAGTIAGNPEFSPDGTRFVNVESTGTDDWAFGNASIVVRSFDNTTNTFGPAQVLMPFDAVDGMQSYYPSWSPDGQWLAVTRSPFGNSYANPDATIWVVKADGTVPWIELPTTQGVMDSWARWMPYPSALGDEKVYFLTFSSTRSFGTRIPDGGLPQIWVAPFFPGRALAGAPASAPAYRAPFQSIYASNHNAQWAAGVVNAQ